MNPSPFDHTFSAHYGITAPAQVPYKILQESLRVEMLNITKSREKIIPIIKALHLHWTTYQTEFTKFEDMLIDSFGKSRAWVWAFIKEMEEELGFTAAGGFIVKSTFVVNSAAKPLDNVATATTSATSVPGKPSKQVEKSREEKPATAKAKTEPEPAIVDKVGREVPAYALGYWKRSTEIQHVLSALSDLRTTIRKANESGDRLWCAFDTQDLLLSFDALYTSVSNFMPYAVCKKCNGVETKTLCSMCHGTGLINKTTYGFNKS